MWRGDEDSAFKVLNPKPSRVEVRLQITRPPLTVSLRGSPDKRSSLAGLLLRNLI